MSATESHYKIMMKACLKKIPFPRREDCFERIRYQCPFCGWWHNATRQITKERKNAIKNAAKEIGPVVRQPYQGQPGYHKWDVTRALPDSIVVVRAGPIIFHPQTNALRRAVLRKWQINRMTDQEFLFWFAESERFESLTRVPLYIANENDEEIRLKALTETGLLVDLDLPLPFRIFVRNFMPEFMERYRVFL